MTKILNETRQYGSYFLQKKQTTDTFKFKIPAGEVFESCRLTTLDTHFGGSAKLDSSPAQGKTGSAEIAVTWKCEGAASVKYQVEAFSRPAGEAANAAPVTQHMTDFLPSQNGWPFDNIFPKVPPFKIFGELRYGDASKGLCGGMVYAALDYYVAGLELPAIRPEDQSKFKSPLSGPVFDYLGKRLFNSFDIPQGVASYIELMHPNFPDASNGNMYPGAAQQSRAWRTIRQEWPAIKQKLDMGHPCPLGLVRVQSDDVKRLGENHQVLTYGYDLVDDDLTLFIYDPNFHANDNITLKLNIADPEHKLEIKYTDNLPVLCFFKTNYSFSMPPESNTTPGRIILFEEENFCGKSIDIVREHPDLRGHKAGNYRNFTSSFVILSGRWSFYQQPGFKSPVLRDGSPVVLGAGPYRRVVDCGIQDNAILSLQAENTRIMRRK
jgi:hypothetical protein